MPLKDAVVKDKLREALAEKGVAATPKQQELLLGYVTTFVKELQVIKKADKMRILFGWISEGLLVSVPIEQLAAGSAGVTGKFGSDGRADVDLQQSMASRTLATEHKSVCRQMWLLRGLRFRDVERMSFRDE